MALELCPAEGQVMVLLVGVVTTQKRTVGAGGPRIELIVELLSLRFRWFNCHLTAAE